MTVDQLPALTTGGQALRWMYARQAEDPAFEHLCGANFVPGEGTLPALVTMIGEAPGDQETRRRRPFVGPAGQALGKLLLGIHLQRDQVFLTNVLKWQPPDHRAPTPAEVCRSREYIEREVNIVGAKVVVLLGRTAIQCFFPGARVAMIHGRPIVRQGRTFIATFHPGSGLLNCEIKRAIADDFGMVAQLTGVLAGR